MSNMEEHPFMMTFTKSEVESVEGLIKKAAQVHLELKNSVS